MAAAGGEKRGDERQCRAGGECGRGSERGLDRTGTLRLGESELVACVRRQRVLGRELARDLGREPGFEAAADVDCGELAVFRLRIVRESRRSRARSERSLSACELTETYSPAAMDMAPATRPASPAVSTAARSAPAAATPIRRLAVETIPSFAPRTEARSQPVRCVPCRSLISG